MTLALTGSNTNNDRRALDFYPTPPEATKALCIFLSKIFIDFDCFRCYEPACGDGALSNVLFEYVSEVFSSDIRHTGYGYGGVDYLAANKIASIDAIITNPPFNEAEKFITKALKEATTVAMLLKSQYWHAKSRFELFNENPPAYVLPLTWRPDFLSGEKGGRPTMEVAWTVWIKGDTITKYVPLQKPL